jgi:hypothetical protein
LTTLSTFFLISTPHLQATPSKWRLAEHASLHT